MKREICWTDNSNKAQVILREEWREGERKREGGKGGEERWRDEEMDLLDRQFHETQVMLREEWREGEREKGAEGEERWKDKEIDMLDRQFQQGTDDTERGMEGGGERERRGQGWRWRRKMKRWICWTDKSTRHR